jgi:hypothetical protein
MPAESSSLLHPVKVATHSGPEQVALHEADARPSQERPQEGLGVFRGGPRSSASSSSARRKQSAASWHGTLDLCTSPCGWAVGQFGPAFAYFAKHIKYLAAARFQTDPLPGGGMALRAPTAARVRHRLEGPGLVLAPDRQAEGGAERVGPLDQPLLAAASGSVTATRPSCLRLRTTTPVSHQVRLLCQPKPAACSVRPIV